MRYSFTLLYFALLVSQAVFGQTKPTAKPAVKLSKKDFIRDSIIIMRPPLVRPQVRIDNRQIFFKQQPIAMNGFDAGVLLKEKLRLTIGYHWVNDKLNFYKQVIDGVTVDRQIKLKYASINTEFIYKNTRYFSLGMPLEFGFGKNDLVYRDYLNDAYYSPVKSGFVFLTDFGLSGTFKPIRWIGIKGIVGYRKTLINGVKDFHFDGFFTSLGLNVDVREILKDYRMFRLKKKYKRGNSISNAVDLITD